MAASREGVDFITDPAVEFPIKVAEGDMPAMTVHQLFCDRVASSGATTAFKVKRGGEWVSTSFAEYYAGCRAVAKALIEVGLEPRKSVAILGFNSPEWFMGDLGAIFAGGMAAGIYATNGPEACAYIINHASAQVVLCEDARAVAKIMSIRDSIPGVKAIVQWSGDRVDGVLSWDAFVALGAGVDDATLDARIAAVKPGHTVTLIYTSGTTGNPKAVMVTGDNLVWAAKTTLRLLVKADVEQEQMISFLPLSHVAGQMLDIIGPLESGTCIWFAQPDALRGSLGETMKEVRPTIFLGVPRVWEKIEEKIRGLMAMKAAEAARTGVAPAPLPAGAVAAMLGLDRSHYNATSAAPIALSTLQFFAALGITLQEVYGMSECTGAQTVNLPGANKLGTVGRSIPGTELAVESPDAEGCGELVYRGRHIMAGYMGSAEASAATITAGGWLHSGDVGHIDADGFVKITGRIKELLITAGGENVPPTYIEQSVKDLAKGLLANVVCIGDRRPFLALLVCLRQDLDPNTGAPLNSLPADVKMALAAAGSTATNLTEAHACPVVRTLIQGFIDAYNATKAISQAQQLKKWVFLPADLSLATGELTPTQKLMRRTVMTKNADLVERIYAASE